ncbi:MAG: acetyl-CoA carboxylase biotin carboxyl carrier protein [Clostridia bacterium]|nr:acetyl-CoA carboxylase biotin carboxyl carrier protein [Clostridia bacterium]
MEYEKIKQLMEDMGNSRLTSIDIDFPDGTKVSMKKEVTKIVTNNTQEEITTKEEKVIETKEEEKIDNNLNIIKSPMVGTFYLKPSPTSEPYVEIGENIKKGQTVCIIEAMKLMNEIESEFDGTIKEIYVKDGETVEYGTPLFGIL